MTRFNAANERIKRQYVQYLVEAKGRDAMTVDGVLTSIKRFEDSVRWRDFKAFHREQAVAFKKRLSEALNARSGERLSKATVLSTLRHLRNFFFWLAHMPGFKSHIAYSDADYFNLSDKDVAIARAKREKRVPTIAQVEMVLKSMPAETQVERRNRAVIAFAMVTGARAAALASFRLGDIDLAEGLVEQDARHVRTKFRKTFRTHLMPVSELATGISRAWVSELLSDPSRGPDDPLFPSTAVAVDETGIFVATGLASDEWKSTGPIREIFKTAFREAGLPYFNPHSMRDMLVRHIMKLDLPVEVLKAWSQNLGHESLLTTLTSYGSVPAHRQGELIRMGLPGSTNGGSTIPDPKIVAAVTEALRQSGLGG